MSRKYRVEQYYTTGWSIVDKEAIKLSKDEARKWLEKMLAEVSTLMNLEQFPINVRTPSR